MGLLDAIGRRLARYLSKPLKTAGHVATSAPEVLAAALRKGDVLLVEGNTRFSVAIGSGDPTKAICSSMIAKAFQSVHYPILPAIVLQDLDDPARAQARKELLIVRHYSLFAPRDFDVSPYFQIVKPTIESGFDPK